MAKPRVKDNRKFSYADYLTWPEGERWEIFEGEAVAMTPSPNPVHQEIVTNLVVQIGAFLQGKPCKVYPAPLDVLLPDGEERDEAVTTVVQPDLLVVCDPAKVTRRGCRGAPDLVVEVLSPGSASRDHITKRRLYERHGVREFWLIDPEERLVIAYRLTAKGRFGPPLILDGADLDLAPKPLPGLTVDFRKVFPPRPQVVRESPAPYRPG